MNRLTPFIDGFIPDASKFERSELSLARNFVFTHLFGPLLSQSIAVFLYLTDPAPGLACWTVIVCTWLFWLLPLRAQIYAQPAAFGVALGRVAGFHGSCSGRSTMVVSRRRSCPG
jgi:hypothetical protein